MVPGDFIYADKQRIRAVGKAKGQNYGRYNSGNAPDATGAKVQNRHQQERDHGKYRGVHNWPNRTNDLTGNANIGHGLLHHERKENNGYGWDHIAEAVYCQIKKSGR